MTGRKTIIALGLVFMTGLQGLTGCGSPSSVSSGQTVAEQQETKELVYESSMELSYAENFSVDYYEGGYKVLTTMDGTKILTVPEDQEIPEKVAINEAVELAKKFGGDGAPAFVNGILAKLVEERSE